MKTAEYKERAAAAGIPWEIVRGIYSELRQHEKSALERAIESRRVAFSYLGYAHGGQYKLAKREAFNGGDMTNIRGFDDVAKELAAAEIPELGADDPATALWELVSSDAPTLPQSVETWERAFERAAKEAPAAPVSPDDLLPLPLAAYSADISEQWLRQLVKAGKIRGFRVGRCWLVDRHAAESFRRHPTAGRPRREAAPF